MDGLLDPVPVGAGLDRARELVAADLVRDDAVIDLVGRRRVTEEHPLRRRADIPRIRAILVALCARAAGAAHVDGEAQYTAELLYLALVVHDVALGQKGGRRRRAARSLVRRSATWLGGNHLSLRALELARTSHPAVLDELVDTLRACAEAQALSEALQGEVPVLQDWEEHADGHTGALFGFCCRVGAHLGGASPRALAALGRYGRHMGRLWHVAEDVSALRFGDAGAHLHARGPTGRPMLPIVRAAEVAPDGVRELWCALPSAQTLEPADELARLVASTGAIRRARAAMLTESWHARRALRVLPESPYRSGLDALSRSIAQASLQAG